MNIQIEQAIIASLLWSHNLTKEEDVKISSIAIDANLFQDTFHRAIISTINDLRIKRYLIDEITVSDSLIKRSMMDFNKWQIINTQTAGGYLFITTYLKMLRENKKADVFHV